MTLPRDPFGGSLVAQLEAARLALDPFETMRREDAILRAAAGYGATELAAREGALMRAATGYNASVVASRESAVMLAAAGRWPAHELFGELATMMRAQEEADRLYRAAFPPAFVDRAEQIAHLASGYALPGALEQFRTPTDNFVDRILRASNSDLGAAAFAFSERPQIEAFTRASAMADMFAEHDRLTRSVREAVEIFSVTDMPEIANLAGYRTFLDAAGLRLSRWPRTRLLSMADKRRRLKARLQANDEGPHVKRAKSMVHRYELTLREILDAVMAETYGEDWAEARLPLCDCKDLLGKWKKRGGDVFDHADYAHYARVMSHSAHFEAIFEAGFDDPNAVFDLLKQAGQLRAASHHAREFTAEDLKALRLTWRQIETGLLALTPDFEVEWTA